MLCPGNKVYAKEDRTRRQVMTYAEKALEISTNPENCQGDNWGDWINLCCEADAEIKRLKDTVFYYQTMQECCHDYVKSHTRE